LIQGWTAGHRDRRTITTIHITFHQEYTELRFLSLAAFRPPVAQCYAASIETFRVAEAYLV
jgi:hypothetical protein